jgi:hypothetical protein
MTLTSAVRRVPSRPVTPAADNPRPAVVLLELAA